MVEALSGPVSTLSDQASINSADRSQVLERARRVYISGYNRLYCEPGVLAKVLLRGARHLTFTFAICIAAGAKDDQPDTWLTLARLKDVAQTYQTASAGQVGALVARMIDLKLLRAEAAPGLTRKHRLYPTELLLSHHRELLAVQARGAAMVYDDPGLQSIIRGDQAFATAMCVASLDAFADGVGLLMAHPQMLTIIQRDSGLMTLYSLMERSWQSPDGRTIVGLDLHDLSRKKNVSIVHTRSILRHCCETGLLQESTHGGAISWRVTDALVDLMNGWVDDAMALFVKCSQMAQQQQAASKAKPA